MAGKVSLLAVCLLATGTINCLSSHSTGTRNVPTPSEVFPQHAQLDVNGTFHLYWKTNATHITFEAHVKTRGYMGFGLSPNGNMYPADIFTGWVKHGHAFLQDRHSTGHFEPTVDSSQDWILLHGEENEFGTVIKTVRKLDTCDDDDVKITSEPVIQKENTGIVHHILLHKCPGIDRKYIGVDFDCYNSHNPQLHACTNLSVAWAIRGGFRIKADLLTPTLRKHDAGVLSTEVIVHGQQIIPPHEKEFLSSGFCTLECLNKGLGNNTDGVNIFATMEHGHLLARKIRTRIIRNGTELEPLTVANNYDFNFQEFRKPPYVRKIMSGDALVIECTYDSTQRSTVTHGGLATTDEMCLSFIIYYPKMGLDLCESVPMYNNVPRAQSNGHAYNYTMMDPKSMYPNVPYTEPPNTQCGV